jgi:N utilization substance protein B
MRPATARRRARELALQGLYQRRVGGADADTIAAHWREDPAYADVDAVFLAELWRGVNVEEAALLDLVAPDLSRPAPDLSPIERAILLIGAWELAHRLDTPYKVVINEAVELAKAYGGIDGHRFVNGVLDKVAARGRAAEIAARRRERDSSGDRPAGEGTRKRERGRDRG